MRTQTDLVTQVAEAKCRVCDGPGEVIPLSCDGNQQNPCSEHEWNCPHIPCDTCQGTGLKHSTLSRECPGVDDYICDEGTLAAPGQTEGCPTCGGSGAQNGYNKDNLIAGSGRVPSVDLEKILELLLPNSSEIGDAMSRVSMAKREHGYSVWLPYASVHEAKTLLEAACAALLEDAEEC